MKIKTTEGIITASEKVMIIILSAMEKAAEYERQKGHLYNHDSYTGIAGDIKRGLNNGK